MTESREETMEKSEKRQEESILEAQGVKETQESKSKEKKKEKIDIENSLEKAKKGDPPQEKKTSVFKRFAERNWKLVLGIIVTAGLMALLIWRSNPLELWNTLVHSNGWLILGSFGITLVLFLIKTIRWQSILFPQNYRLGFGEGWLLILVGTFGSAITPAKVGDILRAFYLSRRRNEVKMGISVFSVVFDRILDLGGIFLLASIFGPFILMGIGVDWWISAAIAGAFVLFILVLIFVFSEKATKPIINLALKLISKIFKKKEAKDKITITTQEIISDFYSCQKSYRLWHYFWLGFLSLLFWVILGLQGSLLLLAFNAANIQPLTIIVVLCIAAIVAMTIPISFSGIGVRDGVILGLLLLILGIESDKSLALSIVQTFLNVIFPGLIGGLLSIPLARKFNIKKEEKELPLSPTGK